MMLRHNSRELGGPDCAQPLGANAGVVRVRGVPLREPWSRPQQRAEQPRGERLEEHREAAVDHRELGTSLAHVMEERCLLQQPARLGVQLGHRLEHVEAVPLVIDR